MKVNDLLIMCLQNLLRRKSRTLLTMLGVVIGCCSIVIMVSIGIGMNEAQQKMLSEMGDLTLITVRPKGNGPQSAKLDDGAVKQFQQMDGVVLAAPRMELEGISFKLYAGKDRRYTADWGTVVSLPRAALDKLGYELASGDFSEGKTKDAVWVGQYFAYSFRDTKRPDGCNTVDYSMYAEEDCPDPYFDPLETPVTLELTVEAGGAAKTITETYKAAGILKEDYSKGYETSQGLMMDTDTMKTLLAKYNRENGKKTGSDPGYSCVTVKVKDIGRVADIEEQIKSMGFSADSMESIRKPMEQEARQKQMMLGGLGGIALVVAALGITNIMIMSISERTKEIGIMKSLGCYVRDIRTLFLMEAGSIGLLGGMIGVALSCLTSVIMNMVSAKEKLAGLESAVQILTEQGGRISVVPAWLILFALLFSVLIGLGAGYYPANKAVQIPALEAIKQG